MHRILCLLICLLCLGVPGCSNEDGKTEEDSGFKDKVEETPVSVIKDGDTTIKKYASKDGRHVEKKEKCTDRTLLTEVYTVDDSTGEKVDVPAPKMTQAWVLDCTEEGRKHADCDVRVYDGELYDGARVGIRCSADGREAEYAMCYEEDPNMFEPFRCYGGFYASCANGCVKSVGCLNYGEPAAEKVLGCGKKKDKTVYASINSEHDDGREYSYPDLNDYYKIPQSAENVLMGFKCSDHALCLEGNCYPKEKCAFEGMSKAIYMPQNSSICEGPRCTQTEDGIYPVGGLSLRCQGRRYFESYYEDGTLVDARDMCRRNAQNRCENNYAINCDDMETSVYACDYGFGRCSVNAHSGRAQCDPPCHPVDERVFKTCKISEGNGSVSGRKEPDSIVELKCEYDETLNYSGYFWKEISNTPCGKGEHCEDGGCVADRPAE